MPEGTAAKNAAKTKADKAISESIITRIKRFFVDSYNEVVKKATWPSQDELKKFTTVVIVAILIVGVWIGGLDFILTKLSNYINQLLGNGIGR